MQARGRDGTAQRVCDLSEEFARRGREALAMSREVDHAEAEVDLIAMIARLRGAAADEAPERSTRRTRTRREGV